MPLVWELSLIGIFEQITTVLRVSRARARYLVRNLTTTPERQGALQGVGESIEQLLPEDETRKTAEASYSGLVDNQRPVPAFPAHRLDLTVSAD